MQMCIAYLIGLHFEKSGSASRAMLIAPQGEHMYARRACCTAFFGATAAGVFLFVLRNSLGTWNVPNLLCRAKTLCLRELWSYRYDSFL